VPPLNLTLRRDAEVSTDITSPADMNRHAGRQVLEENGERLSRDASRPGGRLI
jgi:hypothetical protein